MKPSYIIVIHRWQISPFIYICYNISERILFIIIIIPMMVVLVEQIP